MTEPRRLNPTTAELDRQLADHVEPAPIPPPEDPLAFLGDLHKVIFSTLQDPKQLAREAAEMRAERSVEARDIERSLPGFLVEQANEHRRMEHATVEHLEERLRALVAASPPDEQEAREGLVRLAQSWAPQSGNVLLLGETGVGKSTLAAVLVRRLLAAGVELGGRHWNIARDIVWTRAGRLERAKNSTKFGSECHELNRAMRATVLVIDDLGWEKDPQSLDELIGERFDARAGRLAITITTSGLDLEDLRARYSDAFVRKILRVGREGLQRVFPVKDRKLAAAGAAHRRAAAAAVPVPFNERGER